MNNMLLKLYIKVQDLMTREDGQDLVEYALVLALLSLVAVAALKPLGTQIATIFTSIQTALTNAAG